MNDCLKAKVLMDLILKAERMALIVFPLEKNIDEFELCKSHDYDYNTNTIFVNFKEKKTKKIIVIPIKFCNK